MTLVIGITGGIASGKSTAARMLMRPGIKIFNADACVHALLAQHAPTIAAIGTLFPETLTKRGISRAALARRVAAEPEALTALENVLHPRVCAKELAFIKAGCRAQLDAVVLDVPLLFETGADDLCDVVIAVDVSKNIQRLRAMRRSGMSEEKLQILLARQCSPALRNAMADVVITSNLGRAYMRQQLENFVKGMCLHA